MKRRTFLKQSIALGSAALASESFGISDRPNVLMITCHDIGQHLGCYGVKSSPTENLDRLAERGVRFANFHSTSAVCSPGRGSLHTGRYPQSNGLMGLTHAPWWWKLNDDEKHTAAYLKEAGYETSLIGFNHVHSNPERLGYERALSRKRDAHETVRAAADLFERAKNSDKPFFAKVGFTEVHRRFTHGTWAENGVFIPPYLQDTPDIRSDLEAFQATIRFFDQRVGEILDQLEKSGQAANTLVIMTSDHGIPYPGAKWSARKAGIENPLIMHCPGTALDGGKVFNGMMSNVDVLPTLLDLLGLDVPERIQGISFKDYIEGRAKKPPRNYVYGQYTPDMKRDNLSRCILSDRYHLIRYFDQGRKVNYPVDVHPQEFANHVLRCKTAGTRPFYQLYDIQNDPYELNDIGSNKDNAAIVSELSKQLLAWMKEVNDPLLDGPLRTPYYERSIKDFMKQR